MTWYLTLRLVLYVLWGIIGLLVIKLLLVHSRWRHPLRGNGLMLWSLLLLLVNAELARAQHLNNDSKPPWPWSVLPIVLATVGILVWLWRQLELIPRWLRQHLHRRRTARQVETTTGDDMFATGDRVRLPGHNGALGRVVSAQATDGKAYVQLDNGLASTFDVSELEPADAVQTKEWPPKDIETK